MGRPLILVIRENDRFSEKLRESGCRVINLPLTRTEALNDLSDLRSKLTAIDSYDGLFFTSPAAAEVFVSTEQKGKFRGKVYALGERARAVIEGAGIPVEGNGGAKTARDLIEYFGPDEFAGKRFLFIRGERSMRTIPEMLDGIAEVDEVVVYQTFENSVTEPDLETAGNVNWICFFSPSGVEAFSKNFGSTVLNGALAATIGTTTASAAVEAGFKVDFVSGGASAEEFAEGLIGHIKNFE